MQLPPYVVAYPDLNLIVWKPRGGLDENVVNKVIRFLSVQEAAADRPINRFSDTTLLEAVEVNLRYVFHVALYRRLTYVGRATARSAFLVDNRETAHYFKIDG